MAVRREKANYVIQSVSHALDVLEQFGDKAEELGVTDLSKRLKLHKNNVFRLLATLESRGYIEQNKATENYRLGIRCLEIGQACVRQIGILRQAEPILESLVTDVRENAGVAVSRGSAAVPVRMIEANRPVRIESIVGRAQPLHASAFGKVFLASEGEDAARAAAGSHLSKCTSETVTTWGDLTTQLKQIQRQGYALERGEAVEEIRAVAAPVRDYTGTVVAAVGVVGPAYRLPDTTLRDQMAPRVIDAANALSERLGFRA